MAKRKKNKLKPSLIIIIAVLLAGYLLFQSILEHFYQPVDSNDSTAITFVIPENSTARQVAHSLQENKLIRSEKAFLFYCQQQNKATALKSGSYTLSPSQTLPEIAAVITSGAVRQLRITIPEGYTVEQIGALLVEKQICSPAEWETALNKNYNHYFLSSQGEKKNTLEGFLFPDTYYVSYDVTAEQIIIMLLDRFQAIWESEFAKTAGQNMEKIHQTIIIASLIEGEARVAEERARIAGVIYNRLNIDMPLQIDATILYSMGEHKETITYKDLEVDSRYNTYKYKGLPPGAINCPGQASIAAALSPEKHDYLYYVAEGDGRHYFSRTYDEHKAATNRFNP